MSKMLIGSICLSDIPEKKVTVSEKNGKKYLNIVVWMNDEPDRYGNTSSIQVSQLKEEREAKVKPTYIGNLKPRSQGQSQGQSAPAQTGPSTNDLHFF